MELVTTERGSGAPDLVLLHGGGSNGAVWDPLLAVLDWPGRILAPDFRGHGRSPRSDRYGIGLHAADVAALIRPGVPTYLVGHSMGGAIALALAAGWFGVEIAGTVGIGVKFTWSAETIAMLHDRMAKPPRRFEHREEAIDFYLHVGGLENYVSRDSEAAAAGIRFAAGAWELAADPKGAFAIGHHLSAFAPFAKHLILVNGSEDPIAPVTVLAQLGLSFIELPGIGHNPHVAAPAAVARIVETLLI
jgi:pimeloyl-ACP methyl ester carboxylesterase